MDGLKLLEDNARKDLLRFVTAGSVDDGKSTLMGRLLYESHNIYEDQLEAAIKDTAKHGTVDGDFDPALITDGLKAEREQGITIDVAYRYFSTPRRKFIIADTPGHEEYTRNTVTGASTADLMVILVDATQGVKTQSRRHAFIASLLGIKHLTVAVNKMDLVGFDRQVYESIRNEFKDFCAKLEIADYTYIPVSALQGDNVVERSERMPWYRGRPLLDHLETVQVGSDRNLIDLRFPVQLALRPDSSFRGYVGSIASGILRAGSEVAILPSGRRSRVQSVFDGNGEIPELFPPLAGGVVLEDDVDVSRGDMLAHPQNLPRQGNRVDAMVVWMGQEPMELGRSYRFKHLTNSVTGVIEKLRYRMDVNTLHRLDAQDLSLNEIGRCHITLSRPIQYDPYSRNRATGAFIIVDRVSHVTVGAGMLLDRDPDELYGERREPQAPRSGHVAPQVSQVSAAERAQRCGHQPATVWFTALPASGKTTLGYALERCLFDRGASACVLDGENMRLGLNRDLGFGGQDRSENMRRTAELARILNDAGQIAIVGLISPFAEDRAKARETVGAGRFFEVYLTAPESIRKARHDKDLYTLAERGDVRSFTGVTAPFEAPAAPDLTLATDELDVAGCVDRLVALLEERGILPRKSEEGEK